jgi:hypothetical protein
MARDKPKWESLRRMVTPDTATAELAAIGVIPRSWFKGVTPSSREPACDILAQIRVLLDPSHPKDAIFIAAGNEGEVPDRLDLSITVVFRPEGSLLTINRVKAQLFQSKQYLADADLAEILGYPENKVDAVASGAPIAIQARDRNGNVVFDAITSPAMADATAWAIGAQVPAGGTLVSLSVLAGQIRRAVLLGEIEDPFRETRVLYENMAKANRAMGTARHDD